MWFTSTTYKTIGGKALFIRTIYRSTFSIDEFSSINILSMSILPLACLNGYTISFSSTYQEWYIDIVPNNASSNNKLRESTLA